MKHNPLNCNIYWFHAASLGEFHQVQPVLEGLKEVEPDGTMIVSFSSPSGYEHAQCEAMDLKIYLPFDFPWSVHRALRLTRPRKIIFASYDVWPNMVWVAVNMGIHTNIFAARVKDGSRKLKPFFFSFHRAVYRMFSTIYTVASKDHDRMRYIIGDKKTPKVKILGNPRYDMVAKTADEFTKSHTESVLDREKRIIIGSAHSKDDELVIPALIELLKTDDDLKILYVPHEPNESNIQRIKESFSQQGLSSTVYHSKPTLKLPNDAIVIVAVVGILSKLYWQGRMAYLGGGFSTGIHNVMEPAIARLPIMFGPKYHHAHEAEELLENNGGFCIHDRDEFYDTTHRLLHDRDFFLKTSYAATEVIQNNLGSSTRIVRGLIRD